MAQKPTVTLPTDFEPLDFGNCVCHHLSGKIKAQTESRICLQRPPKYSQNRVSTTLKFLRQLRRHVPRNLPLPA